MDAKLIKKSVKQCVCCINHYIMCNNQLNKHINNLTNRLQMLKYVIILHFVARIFAWYYLKHYLCIILVFFVRKRLRIKMGQMVTERGNHLFLYTFHSKFILRLQALSRYYLHMFINSSLRSSVRRSIPVYKLRITPYGRKKNLISNS